MYSAQNSHVARPKPRFTLQGFGLFGSVLLSAAAALFTFCLTTMIAIFSLLAWNLIGHHSVNFADTYLYVGLPAALLVLAIALPVMLTKWVRSKLRQ